MNETNTESLTEAEMDMIWRVLPDVNRATPGAADSFREAILAIVAERVRVAEAEHDRHRELWAGWLADAATRGEEAVEQERAAWAAKVEAAIRLISPDHITPMGARQIRKVLLSGES